MDGADQADASWVPLRSVDHGRLKEARLQAHYAAQWLARAARAFVLPQPDDAHTNLGWNGAVGGFSTHPFKHGARLTLMIADLTLAWHVDAQIPADFFPLQGRTDAEARQWLGERLDGAGLDGTVLDAPSPYEMPPHAVAAGAAYDPSGLSGALAGLAGWFGNAAVSLGAVQRQLTGRKLPAAPVRCWPHHFDLATLLTLPGHDADATGYVGAGFSPGDDYYDQPYFYVSVYPAPDTATLPSLPPLGHWHHRDFTGAIATATTIAAADYPQAATDEFLKVAVEAAISAIGRNLRG